MNRPFERYAITDRRQILIAGETCNSRDPLASQRAGLIRLAQQLASQGVDYLQLREKDLPAGTIASLAKDLLGALHGSSTRLLINSRADVAVAAGAHGVHLTSSPDELTPQQVHALYSGASLPAPVVTVSCHTIADVVRHRLNPITAILFGPVFEKVLTKGADPGRLEGTGLERLREACTAAAPIPVFALGGVTTDHVSACLEAGAAGIAGIRLFNDFASV